jgi:hypothetical protein
VGPVGGAAQDKTVFSRITKFGLFAYQLIHNKFDSEF